MLILWHDADTASKEMMSQGVCATSTKHALLPSPVHVHTAQIKQCASITAKKLIATRHLTSMHLYAHLFVDTAPQF